MLNYSKFLYGYDKAGFILRYEVQEDKILVYKATGNIEEFPPICEDVIINLMESQVRDAERVELVEALEKGITENDPWCQYFIVGLNIPASLIGKIKIFNLAIVLLEGCHGLYKSSKRIEYKKIIEDFKKNKLFLENKEIINEYLNSMFEDSNMKVDLSMNINDIHFMCLGDLEELIDKAINYKNNHKLTLGR